jgi:XTP/dITP diphosphohydrolase
MKKFAIASKNAGKIGELRRLLSPLGIELVPYAEIMGEVEIKETGRTFADNARIKAEFVAGKTGLPAIADDSGLSIRPLDNFPGVGTARFARESGGYPKAFLRLSDMLKGKPLDAFFTCAIALARPSMRTVTFEGKVNGFISLPARGDGGFGYDPIFVANGMGRTFAEITEAEKNEISHRAEAVRKLVSYLEESEKAERGGAKPADGAGGQRPASRPEKKEAPKSEWKERTEGVKRTRSKIVPKEKIKKEAAAEEFDIELEGIETVKEND